VDFALITASFTVAYIIRIEGKGTIWDRHLYNLALPAVLVARYVFFVGFGLYRESGATRATRDAASIFAAVVLSELPHSRSSRQRSTARISARRVRRRCSHLRAADRRLTLLGARRGACTRVARRYAARRAEP